MNTIFVTGTDTGVGKTFASCLLLKAFNQLQYKTVGIKLIASGCERDKDNILKNDDALQLQQAASVYQPYFIVNPVALEAPVAPHIAAYKMGVTLSKDNLKKHLLSSIQQEVDLNLIEGIGGWSVPLNNHELISEVVEELQVPVILVVGMKLGCLNHGILSYENIISKRVPFIGWIANCISHETHFIQENIQTLKAWIPAPCLGTIPCNGKIIQDLNIKHIQNYLFNSR